MSLSNSVMKKFSRDTNPGDKEVDYSSVPKDIEERDFSDKSEVRTFKQGREDIATVDVKKEINDFPLVPYRDRVYVIEDEVIKSRGIIIPPSSRKEGEMQTNMGFVVAIGEGVTFVEPGDRIFYARYSGAWVMDMKYRVMNEEDILGRFKHPQGAKS